MYVSKAVNPRTPGITSSTRLCTPKPGRKQWCSLFADATLAPSDLTIVICFLSLEVHGTVVESRPNPGTQYRYWQSGQRPFASWRGSFGEEAIVASCRSRKPDVPSDDSEITLIDIVGSSGEWILGPSARDFPRHNSGVQWYLRQSVKPWYLGDARRNSSRALLTTQGRQGISGSKGVPMAPQAPGCIRNRGPFASIPLDTRAMPQKILRR